jgi:hypothetical protein
MVKAISYTARVCVILCFASCASPPVDNTRDQQLIARAEREVSRRGLPLPSAHTARVHETVAAFEIPPYSQYFYTVEFSSPTPKGTVRLYTVSFDRQASRLVDLIDRRDESTSEEEAAAKRAMIQRVGGRPEQFSTGSQVVGDKVDFTILDLRSGHSRSGHCLIRRKTLEVLEFKLLPPTI